VDTYNTLSFYRADNSLIDTITGTQVDAAANGDQGANGTFYVNINSTDAFTYVIATSSSYAFEFDNVAIANRQLGGGNLGTPLPAAAWLFGSVLAGCGLVMRRRRKTPVLAA
jgi:hypothetical protein